MALAPSHAVIETVQVLLFFHPSSSVLKFLAFAFISVQIFSKSLCPSILQQVCGILSM